MFFFLIRSRKRAIRLLAQEVAISLKIPRRDSAPLEWLEGLARVKGKGLVKLETRGLCVLELLLREEWGSLQGLSESGVTEAKFIIRLLTGLESLPSVSQIMDFLGQISEDLSPSNTTSSITSGVLKMVSGGVD